MRAPARALVCAAIVALAADGASATASPESAPPRAASTLLLALPEATQQPAGTTRAEWDYTFLRDNVERRVFTADQTQTGTRSQHRKTHLVTWRLAHGLSARDQAELEAVYKAFRQHTHGHGDTHDRNDDGDFERLFAGWSHQLLQESDRQPAVRLRSGVLLPRRAETEGIGQEMGVDVLAAAQKQVGGLRLHGALGGAVTFDNHDHPADPDFTRTPISKGHDLRTLRYGFGLTRPIGAGWQANLELEGHLFDAIELNRRVHESELAVTPGVFYARRNGSWDWWVGLGCPIGLTSDTDHLGVSLRTGAQF